MEKKTIYLAHTLKSRHMIKSYIEPEIKKHFNVLNPFDGRKLVGNEDEIRDSIYNADEIVTGDLALIDKADAVIAYFADGPSFGTTFEIAYCKEKKKPCMIVTKYINHPWLKVYSTVLCNIDEFEENLEKFAHVV